MNREFHWVLGPLAFAVVFAFVAPVFAADTSQDIALANTSRANLHASIATSDAGAAELADPGNYIATGAPVRLSPLAGNDSIAWDNANSIHPWQRPAKIRPALH